MNEVEQFEEFLRTFYEKELLQAAGEGKKFIVIDFAVIDKFDPVLADKLLNDPEEMLKSLKQAIKGIDLPEENVHIEPRIRNLPDTHNIRIRSVRSEHINKFYLIDGIVRRASEVKPEINIAIFECNDCGNKIHVEQKERTLTPPALCECGRKGNFRLIDKRLFDSRWIVVEEPFETSTGERPGEITIYLKDDLTTPAMQRKSDPGSRLKVIGIIRELKKISHGKMRTQMDVYMEANYFESSELEWDEVTISKEDEKKIKDFAKDPEIYEKLRLSIAPSIYGMENVKDAIILQMFGGAVHHLPDRTRIRGDIHVLLIGDPSVAKSQLLKLVSNIIPRAKYVSGRGSSAAGLTATVLKDEEFTGGWVLEAGAIPLCNKSMISIDEFDKIGKEDIIALHEGMESQTISIAKASIVATLPAEVSILAGANPKFSRFDPYRPIVEQINLPDTILSRFDLKFALRDIPDREKDSKLAQHVLETRLHPNKVEPLIKLDFIRKYIAYSRKYCSPKISKEAIERLKNFYLDMRSMYAGENVVPITLRQNEALIRLTEASAKVRLSEEATVTDSERAINIMMSSLKQLGYDTETGKFDIDRSEGGTTASQRSKINSIIDIIEKLTKQIGKQIPIEEILAVAQDEGIDEKTGEDFIGRLKKEGMIFEPKTGFIQKV